MAKHEVFIDVPQAHSRALESKHEMENYILNVSASAKDAIWDTVRTGCTEWELESYMVTALISVQEPQVFRVKLIIDDEPVVKHKIEMEVDMLSGNHDGYIEDWFRMWFSTYNEDAIQMYVEEDDFDADDVREINFNQDWMEEKFDTFENTENIVWEEVRPFLKALNAEVGHGFHADVDWSIGRNTIHVLVTFEWEQKIPDTVVEE